MPHLCCVPLCTSASRLESCRGLSFHSFPADKERMKKWIIAIRRAAGQVLQRGTCPRVCSLHFDADDYELTALYPGRKRLKRAAVPSVFNWTSTKKPVCRKIIRSKTKLHIPEKVNIVDTNQGEHSCASTPVLSDSLANFEMTPSPDKASLQRTNMQMLHQRSSHDTFTFTGFPPGAHNWKMVDTEQFLGPTMTSMGKVAHEVREMYLSKFKQVSPYTCNAMSPRVLLLRLNPKVIEKYTKDSKGRSDPFLSDEEEDWLASAGDDCMDQNSDCMDENTEWNLNLLEPIVQISSEADTKQGHKRKRGGCAKRRGGRLALNTNISKRKSPVPEEIHVKQERPDSPELGIPNDTHGFLPNINPYTPNLPIIQMPPLVLPMFVTPSQPQPTSGLPDTSFPSNNSESLLSNSRQGDNNIAVANNAPSSQSQQVTFDSSNVETNIKQETPDSEEVIVMPFDPVSHDNQTHETSSEEIVTVTPLPPLKDVSPSTRRNYNALGKTNIKASSATCNQSSSTNIGHESLRGLTTLLVELNNKNTVCDEKVQMLKEEYEKKVSLIEAEKKVNEKEIERVLSLIQNWKEGSKGEVPVPAVVSKRSRKSAR